MPVPRRFRPGYGEFLAAKEREAQIRNGKVLQFVRANPLSTAKQIFEATGFGVGGNPYIKRVVYNGESCYRENTEKSRRQGFQ